MEYAEDDTFEVSAEEFAEAIERGRSAPFEEAFGSDDLDD